MQKVSEEQVKFIIGKMVYHYPTEEWVKILKYESYTEELEVEKDNGNTFRDFGYNFGDNL